MPNMLFLRKTIVSRAWLTTLEETLTGRTVSSLPVGQATVFLPLDTVDVVEVHIDISRG